MAWERRDGGVYYYKGRREGGRSFKAYFGRGIVAELAARLDAEAEARRAAEADAIRAERARLEPLDSSFEALDAACKTMVAATLTVAGYHQHDRGAWRRRRVRR